MHCPLGLGGQFFALEDISNLWRLEDGPELGSGWRLDGVAGVHCIVQQTDDGAVHQQ
jgi:hypothetical protein